MSSLGNPSDAEMASTDNETPSLIHHDEPHDVTISATSSSPAVDEENMNADEFSALKDLTENVRDQDDLERDIGIQANQALIEDEDRKDQKRIDKAELTKTRLQGQKRLQEYKLHHSAANNPTLRLRVQQEVARIDSEIEICDKDIADFNARIEKRRQTGTEDGLAAGSGGKKLPTETQREYLIRTGKITPFAKVGGPRPEGLEGDLADVLINAEEEAVAEELEEKDGYEPRSHQNLRLPGFADEPDSSAASPSSSVVESEFSLRPRKKRKIAKDETPNKKRKTGKDETSDDDFTPSEAGTPDYVNFIDDEEEEDDFNLTITPKATKKRAAKAADGKIDLSGIDDGNEAVFQSRLEDWVDRRTRARKRHQERSGQSVKEDTDEPEWFKPSPDQPDHVFENGLKLPGDIYPSLFDYQKTGVQWLSELYNQKVGGIVGDEMGLGKTGM